MARTAISTLSTEYGISSVNQVAMHTVPIVYPNTIDVGCMSHTLDHVRKNMNTPVLDNSWTNIFARSGKARLEWRSIVGTSPVSYLPTRWWSTFEVIRPIHDCFGDIQSFVYSKELPPASAGKLQSILEDSPSKRKLCIELAITVDVCTPFVAATYKLEGGGPLVLFAYEEVSKLMSTLALSHHPIILQM